MGLFSRIKPKIKVQSSKPDSLSGWVKCASSACGEMVHASELERNLNCCPKCQYHYRYSAEQRVALLADADSFQEMLDDLQSCDPLSFVDTESYAQRLIKASKNTGRDEAVLVGTCLIHGCRVALGVLDFGFMAGSMGSVVGERLTRLIEYAIEHKIPLIIVSSSGGARMQESIFSLMQMAKTSAALARLNERRIPYISILTNPTLGGVTASFASLGDIILAEPDALIGFAGPRVVEQTIRQKLPPGAQESGFLLEKGMIDRIVPRACLKKEVSLFLEFLCHPFGRREERKRKKIDGSASLLLEQIKQKIAHESLQSQRVSHECIF